MSPLKTAILLCSSLLVSACDPGPNGYGTAPAGVSQAEWDARVAARSKYIRGSRPGSER